MSHWHRVVSIEELPLGARKSVMIENSAILIFNLEGDYFAIHNQCTHQDYPLTDGDIEDGTITCPLHGAKFCIKTGEVKAPPAFVDLETYPTRVENGIIEVFI